MTKLNLTELMATDPDGTLEKIAEEYQVSLLDVIDVMPKKSIIAGFYFDKVWDEAVKWGSITLLINSPDIIFEYQGELPNGSHRHGYFNLSAKAGLSGHIKAENCQYIAFVERKFMAMDTASIIFLNVLGQAMFKIFVGRDNCRQLLTKQLTSYRQLAQIANKE